MAARTIFQRHLGELWRAVEPYWLRSVGSDVDEIRRRLDEHLATTHQADQALLLADRLHMLIDQRGAYDAEQTAVVCAAVQYFLEVDDAWHDLDAGGLADDTRVVRAAELAVGVTAGSSTTGD